MEDKHISREIYALSYLQSNKFDNGRKMLSLATNDYERAKAYGHLGDAMRNQNNIESAISYFEKALFYARRVHFRDEEFMLNCLLTDCYNTAGLKNKADITYDRAAKYAYESNDLDKLEIINYLKIYHFIKKRDFCEAISYQEKIYNSINSYLLKEKKLTDKQKGEQKNEMITCANMLSFLYAKCNKLSLAKRYSNLATELRESNSKYNNENYTLEMYFLANAVIASQQNNIESAKQNFDKAYQIAKERNKPSFFELIIEERLLSNIDRDNALTQKSLFNELLQIKQSKQESVSETIMAIMNNDEVKISTYSRNIQFINLLSGLIFFFLILIIFLHFRKTKRIKQQFKLIIDNLEKSSEKEQTITSIKDVESKVEQIAQKEHFIKNEKSEDTVINISKQKEKEILDRLVQFEKGTKFTVKGFTQIKLSAFLKTNTIYTNYILKEHRGATFSEYLNDIRIKYIIQKLYEDPEFKKYKIGYLSDISGFSTHSKFTQAFKNHTKIAPSDFIKLLKSSTDKKDNN